MFLLAVLVFVPLATNSKKLKGPAETEINNIHWSPLTHPGSCFIIRGNQVGQTWLTCRKSVLPTPDRLLVLHMDRDGLQNEILHCLCGDSGGADWTVVPWIILLAILEDQGYIGFLPVLRQLSSSPRPVKDNCEWFSHGVCQLPWHSWMHPWGPMALWMSSLPGYSLTQSSLAKGKSSFWHSLTLVRDSWGLLLAVKIHAKEKFGISAFSVPLNSVRGPQ